MLGQPPYYYINIFSFHFVSTPTLELEFFLFFCLSLQFNFHSLFLQGALMRIHFITVVFPAITLQTHQRWNNVDRQRSSTLMFGWKWKLSRRTFIDVVSILSKQRWNNVDGITSIQRRWTNVVSTLKFGWKWKFSRHMFMDVVSTLRLNFVSTLILGWKGSLLRKQHWNNFVNICGTEVY